MKTFFLAVLVIVSFQSCSSDSVSSTDNTNTNNTNTNTNNNTFVVAYQGDFISGAHTTTGVATVNDSETILRLTDFITDNGPLLEVYLASNELVIDFITLGELQGINGDYDYELPANVDLDRYNHVIIWCVDFSVNFGYAVLQ